MEKPKKLVAAVVLYNVNCQDSLTCMGLQQVHDSDLHVVIYDNSTRDYHNREFCEQQNWVYLGGNGNVGLSKAYNAVIDSVGQDASADLLCLFDDDTRITPAYFEALRLASDRSDRKIFVPLILSGDMLISPSRILPGHRIRLFRSERQALEYSGSDITAINSCMALDLSLFQNYRYDENIFLDGIDHHFLDDMRNRGEKIKVFPYRCQHMFSGTSLPPKASALFRFQLFRKDFSYVLRNDRKAYHRMIARRVLHLTLQYKTADFIKLCMKKNDSSPS